jgi:hypothetical protein
MKLFSAVLLALTLAAHAADDVLGTGTLEARLRTAVSARIQERLAEMLVPGAPLMELFAKVAHEWNAGVLVVTHDHRTLDVFDRILEMEDGRLVERARSSA